MRPKRRISDLILPGLVLAFVCMTALGFAQDTNTAISTNAVQAEMDAAMHQVEAIVNRPAPAYRIGPGMRYSTFHPGWYHPGAFKPDYSNVDVRKTQDTSVYEQHDYVTSDLNPGIVWPGKQIEFNSMTKYFYTNRNVPKKKLTEAEMLEINRLYRIIGKCERQLMHVKNEREVAEARSAQAEADKNDASDGGEAAVLPAKRPKLLNPYVGGGAILVLLLLFAAGKLLKK